MFQRQSVSVAEYANPSRHVPSASFSSLKLQPPPPVQSLLQANPLQVPAVWFTYWHTPPTLVPPTQAPSPSSVAIASREYAVLVAVHFLLEAADLAGAAVGVRVARHGVGRVVAALRPVEDVVEVGVLSPVRDLDPAVVGRIVDA